MIKPLGKGSYGSVYKVQRLEDGGVYAMKETDLSRMGPKERQDAVNEIRVLGSMKHPNVVRHHETFVSGVWQQRGSAGSRGGVLSTGVLRRQQNRRHSDRLIRRAGTTEVCQTSSWQQHMAVCRDVCLYAEHAPA